MSQQHEFPWRTLCLLTLLGTLCGCATGSALAVGDERPTKSPPSVRVLIAQPSVPFQAIALLESRREIAFSRQDATAVALEELKKQAAKLGANAVILEGSVVESGGGAVIGSTSGGFGAYSYVEDEYVVMKGKAIYLAPQ